MNVSLTPELEEFVNAKVNSGRYSSPSDVVKDALRLLEEREQPRTARLADFNQELERRLDALDRGCQADPAEIQTRIKDKGDGTAWHRGDRCCDARLT